MSEKNIKSPTYWITIGACLLINITIMLTFLKLELIESLKTILATSPIPTLLLTGIFTKKAEGLLIFKRFQYALPGHRVFTKLMKGDPRINANTLIQKHGQLPTQPLDQNNLWYSIYRRHKNLIEIWQSQKMYLITRDITMGSFPLIFVPFFSMYFFPEIIFKQAIIASIAQFLLYFFLSLVTSNYAEKFALNVLAIEAA